MEEVAGEGEVERFWAFRTCFYRNNDGGNARIVPFSVNRFPANKEVAQNPTSAATIENVRMNLRASAWEFLPGKARESSRDLHV